MAWSSFLPRLDSFEPTALGFASPEVSSSSSSAEAAKQPQALRYLVRDRVEDTGCVTLRYRRTLHHISLGRRYRGQRVIILMADLDVRVIKEDGELIRHFTLNPAKNYQPRKDD